MHPNVEGYGVVSEGETYHPSAFFDPAVKFAEAGVVPTVDEALENAKSTTTVEVDGVPSNPVEITAEQSNADLATSQIHPDVPNVEVLLTAQPSLVVTKVEDNEPVELTPVSNIVGIEPNGEAPEVSREVPSDELTLAQADAATVDQYEKNQQLAGQEQLAEAAEVETNADGKDTVEVESQPSDESNDDEVKFS